MKNSHKKVLLFSSLVLVVSMVLVTDAAIYIKTGFNFYPKDQTATALTLVQPTEFPQVSTSTASTTTLIAE